MNIKEQYELKKPLIRERLNQFKSLSEENYMHELLFCTLTPQSNAKKCWSAVLELKQLLKNTPSEKQISEILHSKTRFHNNKSKYIINNLRNWELIKSKLSNSNIIELREWLSENVLGFGLKEASHFLRNIGLSNNKIAILDRHILKNLKSFGIIETDKIKNKADYFEIEEKFIEFSKQINVSLDELDLLFWSQENGEIFK